MTKLFYHFTIDVNRKMTKILGRLASRYDSVFSEARENSALRGRKVEIFRVKNHCLIQSPIYYTVCGMPLASNSVIVAVAKTKTKTSTSTCPVILAILRLRTQTTFGRGFLLIENRKITFSKGQV